MHYQMGRREKGFRKGGMTKSIGKKKCRCNEEKQGNKQHMWKLHIVQDLKNGLYM